MRTQVLLFLLVQIFACSPPSKKINEAPKTASQNLPAADSTNFEIPPNAVWGYRFQIVGHFNRDKILDTLTEQFFSKKLGREIPKFLKPDETDIFDLFEPARKFEPIIQLKSSNLKVPNLILDSSQNCRGLTFLQNDGDLDGNGTDEISVINSWNDMSSMNTLRLYTLRDTGWAIVTSFSCREWQVPELPFASATFGWWGQDGVNFSTENTAENREKERVLKDFHLIKKVKKGLIRVETFAEEDFVNKDSIWVTFGDPISKLVKMDTVKYTGFR